MRFYNKLFTIILVLAFFSNPLSAQLKGDIFIGPGERFESFSDAVDSLNFFGIEDNVTFKIKLDLIAERVVIEDFPKVNITDTVVFESETGNPDDVRITLGASDSISNYLVKMDGCSGVTFRNMSFHTPSSDFTTHFLLLNGASNNRIEGCRFSASTSVLGTSENSVVINSIPTSAGEQYNEFVKNDITGGGVGISIVGLPGTFEEGNLIRQNYFREQRYNAITCVFQTNLRIQSNEIDYRNIESGMYIANISGRAYVDGNKVYSAGDHGINCSYHDNTGFVDSMFVTNNMVSAPNGTAFLFYYSEGITVGHNTFYNANKTEETMKFHEIMRSAIQNNLVVNDSAYKVIRFSDIGVDVECNSNGYSNPGGSFATLSGGEVAADFAAWQTSPDSPGASSVFNSTFVFRNNQYDLTPNCGMPDVFKGAPYVDKLPYDINGNKRSTIEPWFGAAEFRLPSYHTADFEGYVTDGTDTLKSGKVKVYADISSDAVFDELTEVPIGGDGKYNINSVEYADEYWLKIIPSDPSFIKSYHNGTLRWDDTLAFKLSDSCDAYVKDIIPRKMEALVTGTFSLSGTITETGGTGKTFGTDPIPGLDVVLDRIPPSKTVAFTTTDENGYYYFGELPEGTYVVTIDYEGLHSDTLYEVNLNSDTTEVEDLDYCVDFGDRIRGCSPEIESSIEVFRDLKVFPNPVNETLYITGLSGEYDFSFTDINGRIIFTETNHFGTTHVNTRGFPSGVYFLTLNQDGVVKTEKIIK